MSEGRLSLKLGDLFSVSKRILGEHVMEPTVFSVTKYQGVVRADEYFDKRIASRDLTKYKVVDPGYFVYSTIHIDEGSIARNNLGEAGVVSPMYTVLAPNPDAPVSPEYLELALRTPQMLRTYYEHAAGSVNRRRSLTFSRFSKIELSVPQITEQLRIVDLISSIDTAIEANRALVARTRKAVDVLLGEVFTARPESSIKLGDLATLSSGPSWAAAQESPNPRQGATPVLKITNTPKEGSIDLSVVAYVEALPATTKILREGDLVLIRTNGNRDRIGNVYRLGSESEGFSYSAFQIGLSPKPAVDGDFLYWSMRAPWVQRAITEAASGTTGLGNIAISWLRELPLWVPAEEEAGSLVELFDGLQSVYNRAALQLEALVEMRRAVLSDVLSGTQEIPESYDRFLKEAS